MQKHPFPTVRLQADVYNRLNEIRADRSFNDVIAEMLWTMYGEDPKTHRRKIRPGQKLLC